MGSITKTKKIDKVTGKTVTVHRAFIRRSVKGRQVSKSKVFATSTEAKTWIRENESDAGLAAIGGAAGPMFSDLLDAFVLAPPTRGTRYWAASHLDFWRAKLGAVKTRAIDRGLVNECKAALLVKPALRAGLAGKKETAKAVTPATANRYLASLSSVLNFALQRGIIDVHPMKGGAVSKETESKGRRRILTLDEEQRLYDACDASTWPMMRLFLRVCLTTAARKSEVLSLKWQYLNLERSVAMLPTTKNDEPRAIPLVADVKAALAEASKVRSIGSDFIFFDPRKPSQPKNIDMNWRAVRKRAGLWQDRDDALDQVVLHTTRHSATTKLVRSEKNLARVQAVTGHKTLSMLSRYSHLDSDDAVEMAQRLLGGN